MAITKEQLAAIQKQASDIQVAATSIGMIVGDAAVEERKEQRAELKCAELQRDNDRLKVELGSVGAMTVQLRNENAELRRAIDNFKVMVGKL